MKQSEDPQRKAIVELRATMQQVMLSIGDIRDKLTSREPQIIRMPVSDISEYRLFQQPRESQYILSLDELDRKLAEHYKQCVKSIQEKAKKKRKV